MGLYTVHMYGVKLYSVQCSVHCTLLSVQYTAYTTLYSFTVYRCTMLQLVAPLTLHFECLVMLISCAQTGKGGRGVPYCV